MSQLNTMKIAVDFRKIILAVAEILNKENKCEWGQICWLLIFETKEIMSQPVTYPKLMKIV